MVWSSEWSLLLLLLLLFFPLPLLLLLLLSLLLPLLMSRRTRVSLFLACPQNGRRGQVAAKVVDLGAEVEGENATAWKRGSHVLVEMMCRSKHVRTKSVRVSQIRSICKTLDFSSKRSPKTNSELSHRHHYRALLRDIRNKQTMNFMQRQRTIHKNQHMIKDIMKTDRYADEPNTKR